MSLRKILVTGHSGYFGSWLGGVLRQQFSGAVLFGISRNKERKSGSYSGSEYREYTADLGDSARIGELIDYIRPDGVVHLASLQAGEFEALLNANTLYFEWFLSQLEAVVPQARIVVVGSAAELGTAGGAIGPLNENAVCEPVDAYGVTKLAQSGIARLRALRGQDIVRLRVFNVVGPGVPERLLPGRCARLLADARCVTGAATLRFGPLFTERDYVDVRDVARAVALALALGNSGALYHIGSGRCRSGYDLVRDLARISGLLGVDWSAEDIPHKALVRRQMADCGRAAHDLGWKPIYHWQASLEDLWSSVAAKCKEEGRRRQ